MNSIEMLAWLKERVEPIADICGRNAYRCSAYLTDGVYLPCVLVCEAKAYVELAIKRLEETRSNGVTDPQSIVPGYYPRIVESFVTGQASVPPWDIAKLELSPFAIPLTRLRDIRGETSMSWTAFAGIMDDGAEFSFGTTYTTEFFNMPAGYSAGRIARIIPHRNEIQPVYRERPFFTCFLEDVTLGKFRLDESDAQPNTARQSRAG